MNPFQTANTTPQTRLSQPVRFTPPPPGPMSSATATMPKPAQVPQAPTPAPTPAPAPAMPTQTQPSSFNVPVPKTIPSTALASNVSMADIFARRNSYLDSVNKLAEAQRYSPDYITALRATQQIAQRDAQIRADLLTGNMGGDTQGFAEGMAGRQQTFNALQGIGAQNALQTQELMRQGNIAGAKAVADAYAPQSVAPGSSLVSPASGDVAFGGVSAYSDYQAQQTYFNLAQSFPDANIPAYNPALSAQQNMQIAQQAAAQSPSFQSRNLMQVTDPSGAIYFVNKNQLQTNPDGSYTFMGGAQAAQSGADRASLLDQQKYVDTVQRALNTADANFKMLTEIVQKAGINNNSPIINQLQNKLKSRVIGDQDIAAFNSLITSVRQEYAQVLARGGEVTQGVRDEAGVLIPSDISLAALKKVEETIKAEGQNIVTESQKQVQTIQSRLGGGGDVASEGWF